MATERLLELLNTRPRTVEESDVMSEIRFRWTEALKNPLWYLELSDELNNLVFVDKNSDARFRWIKNQFITTVGIALRDGKIPLADTNEFECFDTEREIVSNLVIHHTEGKPQATSDELNTLGFLLQYTRDFSTGMVLGKRVDGKPIGSGHFINGKQVFYAYHFLVNQHGEAIRLLEDKHIGWHAGNWNVNKRSVGVALSGNFDDSSPPDCQLEGLVELIKNQYPNIDREKIYGHYQVNFDKTCPGATFSNCWKKTLLEKLR